MIILKSSVHIEPYFSTLDIIYAKYVHTLSSKYLSFNGQTYVCLGNSTCWYKRLSEGDCIDRSML